MRGHSPRDILRELVRFDTTNPPGHERPCIAYIQDLLREADIPAETFALDPERPNLVARLPGEGGEPFLMYGHVDVVTTESQEWTSPPFEPVLADNCMYGRGTLDMKGGVAMMLAALLRMKEEGNVPRGDILFAALADEENGSRYGAKHLVGAHPKLFSGVQYAIGEFGGFSLDVGGTSFYPIAVGEKAHCVLEMTLLGPGGHGSLPLHGGAMARLGEILATLDSKRLPVHVTPVPEEMISRMVSRLGGVQGKMLSQLLTPMLTDRVLDLGGDKLKAFDPALHNTVNATMVRGGEKANVIPSELTLTLDGRLLPGYDPKDLMKELRLLLGDDLEFKVLHYDPAPKKADLSLFPTLSSILQERDPHAVPVPMLLPGYTDARVFAKLGVQTYGFLPMRMPSGFAFSELIHAADERIPLDALDFGADCLYDLLRKR